MATFTIEIASREPGFDPDGRAGLAVAAEIGIEGIQSLRAATLYEVEGEMGLDLALRIGDEILSDPLLHEVRAVEGSIERGSDVRTVSVHRRPGVMDPVVETAARTMRRLGFDVRRVRRSRVLEVRGRVPSSDLLRLARAVSNDVIEDVKLDDLTFPLLHEPHRNAHRRVEIPCLSREAGFQPAMLGEVSASRGLGLSEAEIDAIAAHFEGLRRNPTDVELETLAQTWSEHCKHKTLTGPIRLEGRRYANLLAETIFHATNTVNAPYCRSVFRDNAGVIALEGETDVCFKVETHNHPSAIEPYGGAETGVGGVIRDILGTGLGARPVLSTDVFCFAPPDTDPSYLSAGVLHPRRHFLGVVAGVRDYGNRMGIPTANGAILFDHRYALNPLVYCGTVGILPKGMHEKHIAPGHRIVLVGGRTGRDGVHGATFSSQKLDRQSEEFSGGAVQIGDPITEKKVLDVLLVARDAGEYTAITDCGAGGLSSAIGEMAQPTGARVDLSRVPLKYAGLSSAETWISEAQERMVLAVPPAHLSALLARFASEDVEAVDLGSFTGDGRLVVEHDGATVCDLDLGFLHGGLPSAERHAVFAVPPGREALLPVRERYDDDLVRLLSDYTICSKEWVVRQYDHEVQGLSVVKPFCGAGSDGPSDACVIAPIPGSDVGLAVACGINPWYGELDPYGMAQCCVDEALRNVVAVGGDPAHAAILDNFSWGDVNDPQELGALVRACEGCRDAAIGFSVPFISGKDSLHNAYARPEDGSVQSIPGTLLISAMARVPDVARSITMDLAGPDHVLYLIGWTDDHLGGSRILGTLGMTGGRPPQVDLPRARATFAAIHRAIQEGLIISCHDLSEGGLAVAAAEMAFAGDVGLSIELSFVPAPPDLAAARKLFSESPSRLLVEVEPGTATDDLEISLTGIPYAPIGRTGGPRRFIVKELGEVRIDLDLEALRHAWKSPIPKAFGTATQ